MPFYGQCGKIIHDNSHSETGSLGLVNSGVKMVTSGGHMDPPHWTQGQSQEDIAGIYGISCRCNSLGMRGGGDLFFVAHGVGKKL